MASGDITTAQIGAAVPLCYGPVRATGQKLLDYTATDTTIVQAYGLAEGEWDGIDTFFVNGIPTAVVYAGGSTLVQANGAGFVNLPIVHFHPGIDTPIGTPFTPVSIGAPPGSTSGNGDQLLDQMWTEIPEVINRLMYSRLAYYFVSYLPSSTTTSASLAPVGDFRSTRCRIFDANGNQTQYGYTLNPAWHLVDLYCRRVVKPEYYIQPITGAQQLSSADKAFFDWESFFEAATYFDGILANGRPRFQGAYAFASATTLAAIQEQILLCCRSYVQEYAGKIYLMCDKPRPSTFLMSERHLVPATFKVDQKQVHASANRYIGQFLDLDIPAVSTISTIRRTTANGTQATYIYTTQPNPSAANDLVEVTGVADASFNGLYLVTIGDQNVITAVTFAPQPDGISTGGSVGYPQARFAERTPEINHRQAQLAAGQLPSVVASNSKRLNKSKVQLDFANSSYDQQNRLLKYEITRDLGVDVAPWKPPVTINLSAWSESIDDLNQALKAQLRGDRITLDSLVSWEFAGDYEIMEATFNFFNWSQTSTDADSSASTSGTIDLVLRTYSEACMVDVSDAPTQSFATLPGDSLWAGLGPVNTNYQIAFLSMAAGDAGTSASVTVYSLQARIGGGPVLNYGDRILANQPYSTLLYLFIDDPAAVGGNIPLQATTSPGDLSVAPGRMFIAQITTPAAGSAATSGTAGGSGVPQPGSGSGGGGGSGSGGGSGAGGGGAPAPPGYRPL